MAESSGPALSALCGMFPSWDVEVLEELLETHQGNIERTVDTLLTMDAMPGTEGTQPPQPPPVHDQISVFQSHRERHPLPSPPSPIANEHRGRVQLPVDFLQLPSDDDRVLSEQEERDADLARMLQDQLFRSEVLSSNEFSTHFQDGRVMGSSRSYPLDKSPVEIASQTYTAMRGKITSLSEAMKEKMYDMYTRFQIRNGTASSSDPKSTYPLMASDSESSENDDLDTDLAVRDHSTRSRHSQESPRRRSSRDTTDKFSADTGSHCKKDD
uniref:CUE domain-containing protein n=1 Tax=Peronospora matthiolae TaxID=2874970 RepID=A0AAV1VJ67_9STRA